MKCKDNQRLPALPRATIYSLFSQLLSSPHELKPLSLTSDISFEGLPFDFNVSEMIDNYIKYDHDELRSEIQWFI